VKTVLDIDEKHIVAMYDSNLTRIEFH
jgi:hypothetical protein